MSSVSETIVREYFELHGFFVRQQRKYVARARDEGEEIDFVVMNPRPLPGPGPLPALLRSSDLPAIARAVVSVRGWHTEIFSSAVLNNAPEILRFVKSAAFQRVACGFGGEGALTTILIAPGLPQAAAARDESIRLLRANGINAVIPFQTLLSDLIAQVGVNRNYAKSDLLQTLRILKNYGFFREPQLELFKPRRRRKA